MRDRARLVALVGTVALAVGALLLPTPALAQGEEPTDDEVNAVAKGLYCPVCENVPLDVCPTVACQQWRATIREKLSQGWTPAQIEQYFVDQYGDRVLATPPASGLNWLVYVLPPLAAVAGLVVLAGALRSWLRPGGRVEAGPELDVDDPYVERLEAELRARE